MRSYAGGVGLLLFAHAAVPGAGVLLHYLSPIVEGGSPSPLPWRGPLTVERRERFRLLLVPPLLSRLQSDPEGGYDAEA